MCDLYGRVRETTALRISRFQIRMRAADFTTFLFCTEVAICEVGGAFSSMLNMKT